MNARSGSVWSPAFTRFVRSPGFSRSVGDPFSALSLYKSYKSGDRSRRSRGVHEVCKRGMIPSPRMDRTAQGGDISKGDAGRDDRPRSSAEGGGMAHGAPAEGALSPADDRGRSSLPRASHRAATWQSSDEFRKMVLYAYGRNQKPPGSGTKTLSHQRLPRLQRPPRSFPSPPFCLTHPPTSDPDRASIRRDPPNPEARRPQSRPSRRAEAPPQLPSSVPGTAP